MSRFKPAFLTDLVHAYSLLTLDNERVTDEEIGVLKNRNALSFFIESEGTEQRKEAARGLVRKAFAAAVFHLGEGEALRVWAQTAKKRRAGKKGSRKPGKDMQLLLMYDELCKAEPTRVPAWPRLMGKHLHETSRGQYGQSAEAIEKQVRRLVARRHERPSKLPD